MEQILPLCMLVVGSSGFLQRFLNQFSEFALQMKCRSGEDRFKEDDKRHYRRVLQVGSLPTVGGGGNRQESPLPGAA